MTLETTARAIEFALAARDECENYGIDLTSGEVTDLCRKLLRLSKTVHRLDEYHCNYEENESTKRDESRE